MPCAATWALLAAAVHAVRAASAAPLASYYDDWAAAAPFTAYLNFGLTCGLPSRARRRESLPLGSGVRGR